jgi:general nucleoside transport system ATP-binding protein
VSARATRPESTSASASRGSRAPALRLAGVSKRFPGVIANDDVSLEVERGEIHALLGENGAGKTTLMNIVFGLLAPDAGRIEVDGEPAEISSPRQAFDLGIGMVHQHFKLVPDMTVAENVALARGSTAVGALRLGEVRERLTSLSARFGLEVHPDALIEELSVGEQQRVEIMKLLFRDAALLILDEPTGVLTPPEWRQLASVMRSLADERRSIIFISHKLDEVTQIAERCTVLRDGRVVGTREISGVTKKELARMMVGRDVTMRVSRESLPPGKPVLELSAVGVIERDRDLLADIDLTVAEHEVVGVAGVEGSGQRELVEAITGIRACTGEITVGGQRLGRHSPADFIAAGGALVPADRQRTGVAQQLSVTDNLLLKDYARLPFARRGLLNRREMHQHARRLLEEFDIRATGVEVPISQVSGGNQQKVVLARELGRRPRLLIACQPTRGLDVGAAEFIYERLARYKRAGGAILLISTELDEVLSLADRIAVMVSGRFPRVLGANEANAELLGMLMGGERVLAEGDGSGP